MWHTVVASPLDLLESPTKQRVGRTRVIGQALAVILPVGPNHVYALRIAHESTESVGIEAANAYQFAIGVFQYDERLG